MARVAFLRWLESYSAGMVVGYLASVLTELVSPAFAQGFRSAVCEIETRGIDSQAPVE